ncbi:MAG: hypothetical protein AB4372_01245 [Xenococcus sp. (in: cyanobacteria)]
MTNLTQMTIAQLKHYLSENRSDDDKFSEALGELLKREPNPVIYSNIKANLTKNN